MRIRLLIALVLVTLLAGDTLAQKASQGTRYSAPNGVSLRLTIDESNLGKEISVGEMTFPPNIDSGDHRHGAIEIFYVLEGTLEHIVNGKSEMLTAGMTGYVKPPDAVRHKTGASGAKAVVMWVPGDEAQKIVARWKKEER
jgi:quercetin dioxygenase-like cupin family protein